MSLQNYSEEIKQKETLHLRELIDDLPNFTNEFFRSISQTTSIRTRIGYAYDLRIFFSYLSENHKYFKEKNSNEITSSDLNNVDSDDIDLFMEYLTYYKKILNQNKTVEYQNDEKGKARKLAAVRSMFKYFFKKKKILSNPAALVDIPKIHDKTITRLDVNEVASLLDEIESGEKLTDSQKIFHKKTRIRDLAIVTLLLGTGMRVSECVGINIDDIDFNNNGVKVTRKGGNEVILYFGEEVRDSIIDYLENRDIFKIDDTNALFLSLQGKRISVRSVQNLVKKYSKLITTVKNISPHKLRSTYGTNLYHETGDIYLVADVLGHADVNTTKKHYAEIEDSRRKSAAKFIKLRKD